MKQQLARHRQFLLILVVACIVRLYRIEYPLLDWHSWRQVDTASVTVEYVKHGIDLLHPTYHDLSNIPNGLDNTTHGYRMVEFPMLNALVAAVYPHQSFLSLVGLSRFASVLISLCTLTALYVLASKLWSTTVGLATAASFALIPYSIYYSRVVLPEPAMIACVSISLLAFLLWLESKHWGWWTVSVITLSLALLLKPFAAFMAPVYAALLLRQYGWMPWKKLPISMWLGLAAFAPLALAPLWWWRNWIAQYPEGIPASSWLFNSNGIRLRPAWFRWLGYERFTKMIFGYAGVILALTAAKVSLRDLKKPGPWLVVYAWWLGILLFLITIATGNVQHDYYQVIAVPIVSLTTGLGIVRMYEYVHQLLKGRTTKQTANSAAIISSSLLFATMISLGWRQIGGNFNVNHWEYVDTGRAVDRLVPTDALVIAPAFGDTGFLFQTNRRGWPIGFDIPQKISQGATHYVTTSYDDEARQLEQQYQTIEKNSTYLLLDLTKPLPSAQNL